MSSVKAKVGLLGAMSDSSKELQAWLAVETTQLLIFMGHSEFTSKLLIVAFTHFPGNASQSGISSSSEEARRREGK